MSQSLKQRIYEILESSDTNDWLSRLDDISVTALVILDVADFILQNSPDINFKYKLYLAPIEFIAVVYFSFLYILQLWSCTADPRYAHPIWGRVRYALSPLVIIDLLAILPFFLIACFPQAEAIKSLEIFRLLRLLKLIRYSESLQIILKIIGGKKNELTMTFLAVSIVLVVASSVMFFAESKAQPEAFPSILAAMWWGVVTLTTVGYGDVYPITPVGKLFGSALAFIGIALFALPTGIMASGFSEEIQRKKRQIHERSPEEQQAIAACVEQSAELMKLCVETAKRKFGDSFENEEIIRDLAIALYTETVRKFNL